MTKPNDSNVQRPKAREPRTPPTRRESSTPSKASTEGGDANREGDEKSEPDTAETGAGVTFSGSRVSRGGSDVAQRGTRPRPPRPAPEVAPEDGEGVDDSQPASPAPGGRVIGGASWSAIGEGEEADRGSGFYRFRKADIPDLDASAGSRLGTVIECFGRDLADAQKTIGLLVAKAKRAKGDPQPIDVRPTHHRATRLSKKHRKALG